MAFSWHYLTRRFLLQNNRDWLAMILIGSFLLNRFLLHTNNRQEMEWVCQHIYTDDESDISYRDTTNKTDGAVKRKLIMSYAAKIRALRAEKEREAQLDAFNYLNKASLKL